MEAEYYYRTYNHATGGFYPHVMRVEVLEESAKSYRIRYLEFHANGSRPGTVTWVRKNKIEWLKKK